MKKVQACLLIVAAGVLLYSCKSEQKPGVSILVNVPFLIDTVLGKPDLVLQAEFRQTTKYEPIYIGQFLDSIYTGFRCDADLFTDFERKERRFPDSASIDFVVDTSQIISKLEIKGDSVSPIEISSYTVMIKNRSIDTLNVGIGNYSSISIGSYVPIVMEAIDKTGVWKPIEIQFSNHSCTGNNSLLLPPNQILLTSAPIYFGAFKTKLRLRFLSVYSNEFNGSINLSQFKEDPAEKRW